MKKKPLKTAEKQLGGATGRGFKPGQCGNPGGRPKSMVALILEHGPKTSQELIEFWRLVAFGTLKDIEAKLGVAPKLKDRIACAGALADRLHGRPLQAVEHSGPNGGAIPYRGLADEELDARLRELQRQVAVH